MNHHPILFSAAALVMISAPFAAGYATGKYIAAEHLQKKALAFHCGTIDRETTEFSWTAPSCIVEAEKMAKNAGAR